MSIKTNFKFVLPNTVYYELYVLSRNMLQSHEVLVRRVFPKKVVGQHLCHESLDGTAILSSGLPLIDPRFKGTHHFYPFFPYHLI